MARESQRQVKQQHTDAASDSSSCILSAMSINRSSEEPLYRQIRGQILHEIGVAQLVPGALLPSIRQLASHLGVTAGTVRHAYATLEAEGIVTSHHGKGMLVTDLLCNRQGSRLSLSGVDHEIQEVLARLDTSGAEQDVIELALAQALGRWRQPRTILLVSDQTRWNAYYAPLVNAVVQSLGASVETALLKDLHEHPFRVYNPLSPPVCVLTFVPIYVEVTSLLEGSHAVVYPMALSLSDETKSDLMSLCATQQIAVVAARHRLTGIRHIVELYAALTTPVKEISIEDLQAGSSLLGSDVVLYTLGVSDQIKQFIPPGARSVELHFVPDPVSMTALIEILSDTRVPTAGRAHEGNDYS